MQIMIKIAISGIPNAGTSSLVEEVGKILALKHRVAFVEDISRGHPFNADQTFSFPVQFYCLSSQIVQEHLKSGDLPDILICDRCVLDYWIFWKKYSSHMEKEPSLERKESLLSSLYRFWIASYDVLVRVRIDPKTIESRAQRNQFESLSLDELHEIEEWFLRTIQEDGLKVMEVWNHQTIDECAQQIVRGITERFPDV